MKTVVPRTSAQGEFRSPNRRGLTPIQNKKRLGRIPPQRDRREGIKAALAKIGPPRLSKVYPRTRLFREIDRALSHPVVWIAAPAGYGKTTLVASYLKARKRPTLWYQLDESDADIATYFHYLGLAAKRAAPRARWSLPAFTPEYFASLPVFARRYFEQLGSRLPARTVGVLDNYQEVPQAASLHDVLHNGFSQIPTGMSLIIISRYDPPPAFVTDRANEVMAVIGQEALRLTEEESFGIFRAGGRRASGKSSRQAMRDLHQRSHGWAAGLVLMLERWNARQEIPSAPGDSAQDLVFDYFYRELFLKADDQTQQLLLRTAYLPIVSPTAAQRLTNDHRAGEILTRLHRNNFFTLRHAEPTVVYQYHPLLREFLGAQAQRALGADERAALMRRSAEVLEQEGRIEDAAHLLYTAGAWEALAGLIKRHAPAFLERGRHGTVQAWLEKLPLGVREGDAWLLFWLGACRFPFNLAEAREIFTRAYAQFRAGSDGAGIFLAWASAVETIVFEASNYGELDRWIADLDELTQRFPAFPSPPIEARVVSAMMSALMYRQPQHPQMGRWVERLQEVVEQTPDASARIMLGAHLFVYYLVWLGELAAAERILRLIRPPRGARVSAIAEVLFQVCEANWCWMTNQSDAALEAVSAGQRVADEHGIVLWNFQLTCAGVDVHLCHGDPKAAAPYLARLEQILIPEQTGQFAHLIVYKAWTAMLRGNHAAAVAAQREVLARFTEIGANGPITISHIHLAQLLQKAGESREAETHASSALEIAKTFHSSQLQYWAIYCLAWICFEAGRDVEGREHLRAAFALGREKNYGQLTYYFNDPDTSAKLCAQALEAGIEVDYALAMIRGRGLLAPIADSVPDAWPFPVKIYTLSGFSLVKDAAPVTFTGKTKHRPLGLLKAVLALGGRAVPEAQLTEALWPEAEGDAAHQSFTIALHRLRRLLGCEQAVRLEDRQVTLDPRYVWTDAWVFERLLGQAQDGKIDAVRARALTEKALAYYRGPFLSADAEPWTLAMRERLRGKFLRAIERLGQALEADGQWQAAVQWYQQGLDTDPLAESFYRCLMGCYHKLQRRAEALAVYQRCEATLSSTLGIPPARETQDLYRRIRVAQ